MLKKLLKIVLILSLAVPSQIEARRKCKTLCSLIVERCLRVEGNEVVEGNLTTLGNLSVGTGVRGNLTVAGTITVGGCVLTCTPAGLVVTTPSGATVTPVAGVSAQYAQIGAQPGSIAASQPFTFTTAELTTPGIIAMTGTFPAFPAAGTVFQIVSPGRYVVSYQVTYAPDEGVVLYRGPDLNAGDMLPLPYTMGGKANATSSQVSGSFIVETTTANAFISLNAAAGNGVAIQPGPNSSTTNANATSISFQRIS